MLISPAPLTPMTEAQALGVLQAALPAGFTRAGLLLVAAQSAVETARWQQMYGFNFGNVTPTAAQLAAGADYFQHPTTGSMKYLSFADPLSGAATMTSWLNGHGLFTAAQTGDLNAYMTGLQDGSYLGTIGLTDGSGHTVSQADYDNYAADIRALISELAAVTPAPYAPPRSKLLTVGLPLAIGLSAAAFHFRDALLLAARNAWRAVA